jgi:hypothetical protein
MGTHSSSHLSTHFHGYSPSPPFRGNYPTAATPRFKTMARSCLLQLFRCNFQRQVLAFS